MSYVLTANPDLDGIFFLFPRSCINFSHRIFFLPCYRNPNYDASNMIWRPATVNDQCHLRIDSNFEMINGPVRGDRLQRLKSILGSTLKPYNSPDCVKWCLFKSTIFILWISVYNLNNTFIYSVLTTLYCSELASFQ